MKWPKRLDLKQTEGQSLVEMALAMPILIVLFIALIELGAALRDYHTLINANREGARLAAHGYLFRRSKEGELLPRGVDEIFRRIQAAAGYEGGRSGRSIPVVRFEDVRSSQDTVPANAAGIITYIQISCVEIDNPLPKTNICTSGQSQPVFQIRDYYRVSQWFTGTVECDSRLGDLDALAREQVLANQAFNLEHRLETPTSNDFVIVELCLEHEQWFKFPVFQLPPVNFFLPDPIPMYAQSKMRVTPGSRID